MIHDPQASTEPLPASVLTDTWEGQQTTQGFVALGTPLTEIIRFAGFPDRIEIWVINQNAVIEFTDEQGRPLQEITILAGIFYEPNIRARAVRARNQTAGLIASIQVVGKWRSP